MKLNNCIHVELKGNYKLVVLEYGYGLRGDLYELLDPQKYTKVKSEKFPFKDGKANLYQVKEYFGFNNN